ncbi:MAG TPA: MOSC domain-containing protein [Candidatus Saccharimonadales bacterium]|nr:MOSC domain-containing protein [Candidatus Saccharimonadales bacterium]
MPELRITTGRVEAVLLTPQDSRTSAARGEIKVDPEVGVLDDRHSGDRYVSKHDTALMAMGVPLRTHVNNVRHASVVSRHELDAIAEAMGVPSPMPVGLLAENIVVSDINSLTDLLMPGNLLEFRRSSDAPHPCAVLQVSAWIEPCMYPHRTIAEYFANGDRPFEPAKPFTAAAKNRRGVVCLVLVGGSIGPGDIMTVWQ